MIRRSAAVTLKRAGSATASNPSSNSRPSSSKLSRRLRRLGADRNLLRIERQRAHRRQLDLPLLAR
jgi:hypothetical protein